MSDLRCPACGGEVPARGISVATGIGDGQGNVSFQPSIERTTCDRCGSRLMRNPTLVEHGLDAWRVDDLEPPGSPEATECPKCGAKPGHPCTRDDGSDRVVYAGFDGKLDPYYPPHRERVEH